MLRRFAPLFVSLAVSALACGGSDEPAKTAANGNDSSGTDTGSSTGTTTSARVVGSSPTDGVATFYDADGSGNCSFDASPKNLDVVALDMAHYAGSAMCGACLQVKGPKASITVRVVDSCPGCASTGANLDLSAEAFAKIADPKAGKIDIRYQLVSCDVAGNLAYHFKDGSSQYWTAIQILNSKVPVAKVDYQANGAWIEMARQDYNYFVAAKGVGNGKSLALRVTSSDDQIVEDTVTGGIPSDKTVNGTKQFN